ncbi:hypothetical protein CgunFtcFv8_005488 [Champsocephalus gunnari]|uniref:Uncharacterized protein n=1 Tax=Champsocephalus gunnari TaxID=52237 RepID=A0AAN8HCT3_CHAGU|nr:hypothetical protein CgunFtcFv8_005488 [Champsocephalus gunnari]
MLFWQHYTENFRSPVQSLDGSSYTRRQSASTVGHNDGSLEDADWLTPMRWAQTAASDWLLASFLKLSVAALQASQSDGPYAEGSHVDAWFCVKRCTLDG